MTRFPGLLALGLAAVFVLAGCSGGSTAEADSTLIAEFRGADPALKAKVESTVAAFKTNNYVGAITFLKEVAANGSLTSKQQKAIEDMQQMVTTQMYQAIDKGDTNAIMARDILQELRRQRRK